MDDGIQKDERRSFADGSVNSSYGTVNDSKIQNDSKPVQASITFAIRQPKCTVIVEPLVALVFFCVIGSLPLTEQYFYARFARDYPALQNSTKNNESISETCRSINSTTSDVYNATQAVQATTSQWMMYLSIISCIPSILSTLIIGGYSDVMYRKPALLLPSFGVVIKMLGTFSLIYFDLDIYVLVIISAISSCFGGAGTLMAATFTYIADITSIETRASRIVMLDVILALSGAAAEPIMGFLIRDFGFSIPSLIITVLSVLAFLYVIIIIPETRIPSPGASFSLKKSIIAAWKTYTKAGDRRAKLALLMGVLFFALLPIGGGMTVSTLFQLNHPLCWDAGMIGIYLAVALLLLQGGSLMGAIMVRRCLSEKVVCLLGTISGATANIYYAFCRTTLMVFFVPVIGLFDLLPIPLARALASKLVQPDEQGALFAGMAVMYNVGEIISSLGFNEIYQFTLSFFPGFIFLTFSGFYFMAMLLICVFTIIDKQPADVRLLDADNTPRSTVVE